MKKISPRFAVTTYGNGSLQLSATLDRPRGGTKTTNNSHEVHRIALSPRQNPMKANSPRDLAVVRFQADSTAVSRQQSQSHALYGALVAKQLLDARAHQARILAQARELVGMLQQRVQPVAEQVRGRLVAGDE